MNKIKLVVLFLALALMCGCAGCGQENTPSSEEESSRGTVSESESGTGELSPTGDGYRLSKELNIAVLKGPTGIGMAKLFEMEDMGFKVSLYDAPDQVTAKLISGEIDVAAIPSNLGAVLFNKTGGAIRTLAINTGGTLYLLEQGAVSVNSIEELKGMDIWASGQGAVPEFVLRALLDAAGLTMEDVNIHWLASHTDVISTMATVNGGFALLPEPHVSIAQAQSVSLNKVFDLNDLWKKNFGCDLPMGILAARSEVIDERADTFDIEKLLGACAESALAASDDIDAVAAAVTELGIVGSEAIAKKAIPNCNIMFETGSQMRSALDSFYRTLFDIAPQAVGGAIPTEEYYY